MKAANSMNFYSYSEKILAPHYSEKIGRLVSVEEMAKTSSLDDKDMARFLRSQNNIYLLHNANDFLVNDKTIHTIRDLFPGRHRLFKRGGHMGSLWHASYLNALDLAVTGSGLP